MFLCQNGHPVVVTIEETRERTYSQTDDGTWEEDEGESCTERSVQVFCAEPDCNGVNVAKSRLLAGEILPTLQAQHLVE